MYTANALDVRLTELLVDADQLLADSQPAQAQGADASVAAGSKGLLTVMILGVAALLLLTWVGMWLYGRRQRITGQSAIQTRSEKARPDQRVAAQTIILPCPHCGKKCNVKMELAGKKVKCPHCGQVQLVPEPAPPARGETRHSVKKP
jgi:hypothetical protein